MATSRVELLVSRILRRLKDRGEHDVQRDEIISEMSQVQNDLCKDYFALKTTFNLSTVANQATYALNVIDTANANVWRILESIEPTTWKHRITWVHDATTWGKIMRRTLSSVSQPVFGFTWNKIITLHPAPTDIAVISIIGYALPSKDLVDGGNPEVSQEWDESLMLGTLNKIVGGDYERQYKEEVQSTSSQLVKESINGVQRIDYPAMSIWGGHHHHDIDRY